VDEKTILHVDDDSISHEIVKGIIGERYQVVGAGSGEECLEKVTEIAPSVILLDVRMPGIDGYETCRRLREMPEAERIPVIFISALASVEERLTGYAAGGNEYISKPFEPEELVAKISVAVDYKLQQDLLSQQVEMAQQVTMQALTTASEFGVVVRFLEESFQCESYQELVQRAVDTMTGLGLKSTIQIRAPEGMVTWSDRGEPPPLEQEMLELLVRKGRLHDFGSRTVINYPRVSMLVKNMPVEDEEQYGRYRDSLAVLVEGAEARVSALIVMHEMERQRESLIRIARETTRALESIEQRYSMHKIQSAAIMDDMLDDLEELFFSLGLDESQEQALLKTVRNRIELSNELYESGLEINKEFERVMDELRKVSND
jgi:CheY-like chemotaxis protein